MLIFPNPTQGIVNIVVPETLGEVSISITNIQGKKVKQYKVTHGGTFQADLSQVGSGVYFVKINAGHNIQINKIVVN